MILAAVCAVLPMEAYKVVSSDAELFRLVGNHLWGSRWQTDMAIALGVNDRTVRRWVSGAETPRPGVWTELIEIIRERREELGEVIERVERRVGNSKEG
jgi:hypothetical protein